MPDARLKSLIKEVLESTPKPYTDDLIEDVFLAIEQSPRWKKQYDDIQYHLGKSMVNPWGGFWVAQLTGRIAGEQVSSSRTRLLESYAKLAKGPKSAGKKVKEAEALQTMSDYFFANRQALPSGVRDRRNLILELIMSGFDVAEAFAKSVEKPAVAR